MKLVVHPEAEKLRDEFLFQCAAIKEGILKDKRVVSTEDKMDLLVFSLLALIDGVRVPYGPYPLTALSEDRKREYQIWGDLHDNFHRIERERPCPQCGKIDIQFLGHFGRMECTCRGNRIHTHKNRNYDSPRLKYAYERSRIHRFPIPSDAR